MADDTRMDFRSMERDRGSEAYADIATSPRPGTVAYPGADTFIPLRMEEGSSLESRAYSATSSISLGMSYDAPRSEQLNFSGVQTYSRLS